MRPDPVMTIGKYKGIRISEINDQYLIWFLENCDTDRLLRACVGRELKSRLETLRKGSQVLSDA